MAATTKKRKAKESMRSDDVEVESPHSFRTPPKLNKDKVFIGVVYKNPVKILITFEIDDHTRAIKLMNKTSRTFTKIVNDALKAELTKHKIPEIQ